MLNLEEYIADRKRKDCINEFNPSKRINNLRLCLDYVLDYFEKYMDPDRENLEIEFRKNKSSKYYNELKNSIHPFDNDIIRWYISIYEKLGKKFSLTLWNYLSRIDYFLLYYQDSEFIDLTSQCYKDNYKILRFFDMDNTHEMLLKSIMAYFKLWSNIYNDDFTSSKIPDTSVNNWIISSYREYGVNIYNCFKYYIHDFLGNNSKYAYNPLTQKGNFEVTYDYKNSINLFGIDQVYEKLQDRPFICENKQLLEMLLMHLWLSYIEDEQYWGKYIKSRNISQN